MSATELSSRLTEAELRRLLESAAELSSWTTLRRTLETILELAARLTQAEAASVILHDPERDDLFFAAALGPNSDRLSATRIPRGEGKSKAGRVFATGEPLLLAEVGDHYRKVDEQTQFITRSMICVPLAHAGQAFGVMQLLNSRGPAGAFQESDLSLAMEFAKQAGRGIHNARLFEHFISSSGLYAKPEVREPFVAHLLSPHEPAVRDRLTILFADMRGFTRLTAAVVRPEKLQRILGDLLAMMASAVLEEGGVVNKFLGDGVMAFYRGPTSADAAVQTAYRIIEGFERLRVAWSEVTNFNLDYLDVGVTIATDDDAIIGRIGDERFCELTAVGLGVNLAAGLQEIARGGRRIICDGATFRQIRDRSRVLADPPVKFALGGEGGAGPSFDVYPLRPPPPPVSASGEHDVFISYRRDGGTGYARAIQQALGREARVFLDVEKLAGGPFDDALRRHIQNTPNFLVLLSPGALDRCHTPGDWLREELRTAFQARRNVVPVRLDGFQVPSAASLPEDVRDLVRQDFVEYSHRYFDAMIAKVRERLVNVQGRP